MTPEEIEKLRERREQEINASLVKLNNDIYQNEKGLSERDRVYLVAASIIATLGVPGKVAALEKYGISVATMKSDQRTEVPDMFRRKNDKRIVELNPEELRLAKYALLGFRNKLVAQGKPTEDVNALLLKIMK